MQDGTTTPPQIEYPDWLEAWGRPSASAGCPATAMVPIFKTPAEYASEPRYKMVELHNIVFLGSRIAPQTYKEYPGGPGTPAGTSHTVAGVAKEFAEELMRAQRRIFQALQPRRGAPQKSPRKPLRAGAASPENWAATNSGNQVATSPESRWISTRHRIPTSSWVKSGTRAHPAEKAIP